MKYNLNQTVPEQFFIPASEAAKQGSPSDAMTACLARLSATVSMMETELYDQEKGDVQGKHTADSLWAVRGQIDTLSYLHSVQSEYISQQMQGNKKGRL